MHNGIGIGAKSPPRRVLSNHFVCVCSFLEGLIVTKKPMCPKRYSKFKKHVISLDVVQ